MCFFSRDSLRKCWTLACFSKASMLCRLELTSHESVSYRQWIDVTNIEEGHLKAGHTAAKVVLGKVWAALMSSLLDVWMRRADVRCTQRIIWQLYVSLSRRSHRHGNTKQWAPLKRLSSVFSPPLSRHLLSSLRPFHLFHPQQSDGGEQQDGMILEISLRLASFPSNSPNVLLVCQRQLTFQGLRDHFFLWEHLFIFS